MNNIAEYESILNRAYEKIREQKSEIARLAANQRDAIAIVGYACRFPGASVDGETFWRTIERHSDVFSQVGDDRWSTAAHHDPQGLAPGRTYTLAAGLIDGIDRFDASFFGIPAVEANALDPQHRLLLEVSWHALENAGISPRSLRQSKTGTFVGLTTDDYSRLHARSAMSVGAYTGLGSAKSMSAARLAYFYDLRGPAVQFDTTCSSALVAAHTSMHELRQGNCDLAIVAGANAIISPDTTIGFCEMRALSRSGKLRAFDDGADGYVRGEGCGVLILKRHKDAVRDGDRIHALIVGSAMNHDGRTNGLTAPNPIAQEEVIRAALHDAGCAPDDIQYVEAHGTGTRLGDLMEANALGAAYGNRTEPLRVGAVKANIGHLEAAAGVASLIKLILCLEQQRVPGQVNLNTPNRRVDWNGLRLSVSSSEWEWRRAAGRIRRAGVSAFGMSGTNVHLIVQEPPERELRRAVASMPLRPLLLTSGRTEYSLRENLRRATESVRDSDVALELAFQSQLSRFHFDEYRAAIVLGDTAVRDPHQQVRRVVACERTGVVLVFGGAVKLSPAFARDLYERSEAFREAFDAASGVFLADRGRDLVMLCCRREEHGALCQPENAIPALVAFQIGMVRLWRALGISIDAAVGYGIGEFAAAAVAGALSSEVAMRLACTFGATCQSQAVARASLEVSGEESEIRGLITQAPGGARLVGTLSARRCILSCAEPERQELVAKLGRSGFNVDLWGTADLGTLERSEESERSNAVAHESAIRWQRSFVSPFSDAPPVAYLKQRGAGLVEFQSAIEALLSAGYRRFLEVGPGHELCPAIREVASDSPVGVTPSFHAGTDTWSGLTCALAELFEMGTQVNWGGLWASSGERTGLPGYAFDRQRFWLPLPSALSVEPPSRGFRVIENHRGKSSIRLTVELGTALNPHLDEHRLFGVAIMAGASWIALWFQIAARVFGVRPVVLEQLQFLRPLVFGDDHVRSLNVSLESDGQGGFHFSARSNEELPHCEGRMRAFDTSVGEVPSLEAGRDADTHVDASEFYRDFDSRGYTLGAAFRWMADGRDGLETASRRLVTPSKCPELSDYPAHPGLVDSSFHSLGGILRDELSSERDGELVVPAAIDSIVFVPREQFESSHSVRARRSPGKAGSGDIDVLGPGHRLFIAVRGVSFRRISRVILERIVHAGSGLQILGESWQPLAATASAGTSSVVLALSLSAAEGARSALGSSAEVVCLAASSIESAIDGWADAIGASLERTFAERDNCSALIVDDFSDVSSGGDAESMAVALCDRWSRVLRAWLRTGHSRSPKLQVLVRGCLRGASDERRGLASSALVGFLRSVSLEQPRLELVIADSEREELDSAALASLYGGALEHACAGEYQWDGTVWKQRQLTERAPSAADLDLSLSGGIAIVSGGNGGLAPHLAEWLLAHAADEVLLLRRSSRGVELSGDERLSYRECDICDEEQVATLFRELRAAGKRVRAVVHAAGALADKAFENVTVEDLHTTLAPKLRGGIHLAKHLDASDVRLVLAISSLVSLTGSAGQSAYCAANRALDTWVQQLRDGGIRAVGLNLGPIDVGMAKRLAGSHKERLERLGVGMLSPRELGQAIDIAVAAPDGAIAVLRRAKSAGVEHAGRAAHQTLEIGNLQSVLGEIATKMQELLGTASDASIVDVALTKLGADSLLAVELSAWIQERYGVELSMEEVLAAATLRTLAEQIVSHAQGGSDGSVQLGAVANSPAQWTEGSL